MTRQQRNSVMRNKCHKCKVLEILSSIVVSNKYNYVHIKHLVYFYLFIYLFIYLLANLFIYLCDLYLRMSVKLS